MLRSGRITGLAPALFLGALAACSDSAMGPSASADAVRFPIGVNRVAQTEEVCETIDFEGFAHGTTITNQISVFGNVLTFSAVGYDAAGNTIVSPVKIYSGTHEGGPDFDLESAGPGALCPACTSNMAVIQEIGSHEGGATSDNTWGGEMTISGFPAGIFYIKSFQLADHEVATPPQGEPDARLFVNGVNVAETNQPDGVNDIITVNTTAQPFINTGSITFVFGNPPTQQGSEAIDNIKVCKLVEIPPPSGGCTYTKGWYQNKNGSPTVIAVDGRTKEEAQAIFKATPGQPGSVTWGTGNKPNNLLNLYQQLLAALNNLGGDANVGNAPADVAAAIQAAQAGTGGTGLHITTTLTDQQIGELAGILGNFNDGKFAGWPHCETDEDDISTKAKKK